MGYHNARGMAESGIDIDTALGWLIDLPAGVVWKGKRQAPASAIVDGHHLEAFIDAATEEDSE